MELRGASHPNKEVRAALEQLLATGAWTLISAGHWGQLRCLKDCKCKIAVSGTPRNATTHAKQILREAGRCPLPLDSGYRKPSAQ